MATGLNSLCKDFQFTYCQRWGIKRGMRKRAQGRINKLTGVSCLCERIWGGSMEMWGWDRGKCKILFPRINLFPGSAKWLGILSCTLSSFRQHVSLLSVCPCAWRCGKRNLSAPGATYTWTCPAMFRSLCLRRWMWTDMLLLPEASL